MKESVKGLTLEGLYDLAYRAHSGTSFVPEKRAASIIRDYSNQLNSDLSDLGDHPGNYKEKYIQKLSAWLAAKSNCLSVMITGPSGFPTRRAEKANNSEHNRWVEFTTWRDNYFKAVNRVPRPKYEDALDEQVRKLQVLEIHHERMKLINKLIRKHGESPALNEAIEINEIPVSALQDAIIDWDGVWRVPQYKLTNNNANIKRVQDRIKDLEKRIQFQKDFETIEFPGGSIEVENDRVKIYNDSKPEQEIINLYKKHGFRWSPKWKCWVRQFTENAMRAVKYYVLPVLMK